MLYPYVTKYLKGVQEARGKGKASHQPKKSSERRKIFLFKSETSKKLSKFVTFPSKSITEINISHEIIYIYTMNPLTFLTKIRSKQFT